MDENQTESFRIKGRAGRGDIRVGSVTGCPAKNIEKMRPLIDGAAP